jgi:hypothetical protein
MKRVDFPLSSEKLQPKDRRVRVFRPSRHLQRISSRSEGERLKCLPCANKEVLCRIQSRVLFGSNNWICDEGRNNKSRSAAESLEWPSKKVFHIPVLIGRTKRLIPNKMILCGLVYVMVSIWWSEAGIFIAGENNQLSQDFLDHFVSLKRSI